MLDVFMYIALAGLLAVIFVTARQKFVLKKHIGGIRRDKLELSKLANDNASEGAAYLKKTEEELVADEISQGFDDPTILQILTDLNIEESDAEVYCDK